MNDLPFTIEDLEKAIEDKKVSARPHPESDLTIYNYTPLVQYSRGWDEVTKNCRGLVLDSDYNVVARPFQKIFNYTEIVPDPVIFGKKPIVHDKLDGCFTHSTKLNLWEGGTIKIGDIVNKKLTPTLVGMNSKGELVPSKVVDWFSNGTKKKWLSIEIDCPVSLKSGSGNHPNRIIVTPNHEIYLNNKWSLAIEANEGDNVITFEKMLDQNALHLIKSGLLGDGSISKVHNAYRYQEPHSKNQHEYVDYINNWLGSFDMKDCYTTSGFGSEMKWAQSPALKSLKDLRQEWYPKGTKIVPHDLSWVDDFAIAKWYMDDGALMHSEFQKDRATFSTDSFSKEDVERLGEKVKEMYGINYSLQITKGNFALRINAGKNGEINTFWEAIAPHIIPSLRYKLPIEYRNTEYIQRNDGNVYLEKKIAKIIKIEELEYNKDNFPHGAKAFDIKTETGNYFAKGMLVHNSLGIIYKDSTGWRVATRGSFESDQALWATEWLPDDYDQPDDVTTLVEIIYPENRICVNYNDRSELVLIAAIDNETGADLSLDYEVNWWKFSIVERHPNILDVDKAYQLATSNEYETNEGVVCRWDKWDEPSFRLKIKHPEYVRLHGIIHNFSEKKVWEYLSEGKDFLALLSDVPDEFYAQVDQIVDNFYAGYSKILQEARSEYDKFKHYTKKKDFALKVKDREYSDILFNMFDNRDFEHLIWKRLKPKGE